MKIESNNGLFSGLEWKIIRAINDGDKTQEECINICPLLPNTVKEIIISLISKGIIRFKGNKIFLTTTGEAICGNPISKIKPKKENKKQKTITFAHNLSKKFWKKINKAFPIKGSPDWNIKWEIEVARLHTRDGYTIKEIADTLDFIISDVNETGFCFARNIRSLANIRIKWKNGMTKFSTAYNAMLEKEKNKKLEEGQDENNFEGKWSDEASEFEEDLVFLPHPGYSNPQKSAQWNSCCVKIAGLIFEFVNERKWPASLFGALRGHILDIKKKGFIFNTKMLIRIIKEFFAKYKGPVGYIDDENGGHLDDTYMDRIAKFEEEASNGNR